MACAALVSQLALMLARTMAASPSAPSGRQPEAADSSGPLPPPPPPPPVVCTRPTGRAGYDWDHGPAQETLLWSAFAVCARVHNGLPACGLTYRAARQRAQQSKLLLGQRKSKGAHTGAEMAKDWRCTPSYLIIVRA
jgi:hypothetical protein